jgi:N-acetylglutamate synthase-like GNAT family acetyltransferase
MRAPIRAGAGDAFEIGQFLRSAGLTTSGLDDPDVVFWIDLDADGGITATVGLELGDSDALIRSLAVQRTIRHNGRGTELARYAIAEATRLGARRAWAMSRRSGPFWQALGFETTDIHQLTAALLHTTQVRDFALSGQLDIEVAWRLEL